MTRASAAVRALLALLPACFHPIYAHTACPTGECPAGLVCNAQQICEPPNETPIDAGVDAPPDAVPDARTCFGTGLVVVCLRSAPAAPLPISVPTPVDTTSSSLCVPTVSGGDKYCVIAATTITIDARLRATGAKPLVLIASDSIVIAATGAVDVGSHRGQNPEVGAGADPLTCTAGTQPGNSGGGAGGSFLGSGGGGGNGGNGGAGGLPAAPAANVAELRGGCAGQDGNGTDGGARGHGGGAVFLIAGNAITVGGVINATGEGGDGGATNTSGGGGGGAGGMIGLDAPTITATGLILASGGGGGEGSGEASNGDPGHEAITTAPAIGGNGQTANGGNGGNGSSAVAASPGANGNAGNNQANNRGGGGGGGGGAGVVKAPASSTLGTQVSPPATP